MDAIYSVLGTCCIGDNVLDERLSIHNYTYMHDHK